MSKPKLKQVIGFIGAGNMARSIAGGLIANGWSKENIILSDPNTSQKSSIEQALGVNVYTDNAEIVRQADILVLAVKPQILKEVALEIADQLKEKNPLLISIAAGIRVKDIAKWTGSNMSIVRAMPNTPALIGAGACGLFANKQTTTAQHELAESILRATGVTVWVDNEKLLDVITALSGSGPAYFLLLMETMVSAAVKSGLDQKSAELLTLETALGAAKMALESEEDPGKLRARVTSPGGTTEAAINTLEQGQFNDLIGNAINAATMRSKELADIFGSDDNGDK